MSKPERLFRWAHPSRLNIGMGVFSLDPVSLLDMFDEQTHQKMLLKSQLTLTAMMKVFGLKLRHSKSYSSKAYFVLCSSILSLQQQYRFDIVLEDAVDIIYSSCISGGADCADAGETKKNRKRKKKSAIGRKTKKSKKQENHVTTFPGGGDAEEPDREPILDESERRKSSQKKYQESEKGKSAQVAASIKYVESEKGKATSKRYEESEKGKAASKKYEESEKGKAARAAALKKYERSETGKAARAAALKKYEESETGKAARAAALKKYEESETGKAARAAALKKYEESETGKAARAAALKKYEESETGKAARAAALKKYEESETGKAGRAAALKKYRGTENGRAAEKKYQKSENGIAAQVAASKKYQGTEKQQAARRKYAKSKGKAARLRYLNKLKAKPEIARRLKNNYMKKYRDNRRRERKQKSIEESHIDFSNVGSCSDTHILQTHQPSAEIVSRFNGYKKSLLKGRQHFKHPFASGWSGKNVKYKFAVAEKLESAIEELHLSDKSLKTAGITIKNLKNKYFNSVRVAAKKLSEAMLLKREQCVSQLKLSSNRLKSLGESILATIALQTKDKDKEVALLGLQCHNKGSEPYLTAVSYKDRTGYDYVSGLEELEKIVKEATKSGKVPEIFYKCTKNCILLKEDERLQFEQFVNAAASLVATDIRTFVQKYMWCTKHHEYAGDEGSDLDPRRMYMFPVKRRNHPEECYIPLPKKKYETEFKECISAEVLIRKAMVHYENGRKFYRIMKDATKAHSLLCDIDASTMMGDLTYLSKINKVTLKSASTVSEQGNGEARQWTSESIEAKLSEPAKEKSKATYMETFQKECSNLPKIKCWSCNILCRPSDKHVINIDKWKALKFNPVENKRPNSAYQTFNDYLVDNNLLEEDKAVAERHRDHPAKWLHGLEICNYCYCQFLKDEVPGRSLMNKMYTGECPAVIKELNPIELMFVSQVKCFQTLIKPGPLSSKLPDSEKLSALQGHFIHLPLSTAETFKQLRGDKNNMLFDVEDLVLCYGKPKKNKQVWCQLVDRKKVYDALKWLCEHNKNYKDITLPEKPEDILPDVFGKDEDAVDDAPLENVCIYCSKTPFDSTEEYVAHQAQCEQELLDAVCESCFEEDTEEQKRTDYSVNTKENSDNEYPSKDDAAQKGIDKNNKPWIQRMTHEELDNTFGHLTVSGLNIDVEAANDLFKKLDISGNPIATYADNLDCLAFPNRFPYGEGGRTAERSLIKDAFFEKAHVMSSNSYARRNLQYLFFMCQQREIRQLKEGIFTVVNSKENESLTKEKITAAAKMQDPELLKKVANLLRKLPSQKEFWHDVKCKVEQMVSEYGPATFWLTLSPGDYDDEELYRYLREMNADLPGIETMTPSQLISRDPVLACTYLQTKFDAILKFILSDAQPLGKVSHYFVRTEYQTRLLPHYHCFFWIDGAPIIGVNSDEEVLECIMKNVSCKLPSIHDDAALHNLVKRYQYHKCNGYCIRKPKNERCKARCKFSFPREPRCKAVLHSVLSSIVSRQSRSYQRRLYEIERTKAEERINDYNPILMMLWSGNMDIQFIGEKSESLVDYICKYATKAPKSAIDDFHVENMIEGSDYSKLMSLAMKLMKKRELGAMEARNYLLAESPYRTDAVFQYVNALYPHKRKRMLKRGKQYQVLPDDSKDLYLGDVISTWYPGRPTDLEAMSLYGFVRTYQRASADVVRKAVDKSKLLKLKDDRGYMIQRTVTARHPFPPIVYGPTFLDPVTNKEEFFYSHLLMHKPWFKESALKGETSATFEAEFNRLKEEIPALEQSVKKVFRRRRIQEEMQTNVNKEVKKTDDDEEVDEGVSDQPDGSDYFETIRKQSLIETEEQLEEAVASFSEDQLKIYRQFVENVEHYYAHRCKPPACLCMTYKPLRMFVSGFGGSGKSYLIRALMGYQFVKTEVKKEACHILLGAPTGIASCNVAGQTLHSMWNLPVEHAHKSEYRSLLPGVKNRMKANYSYACAHLMDEVSMVSNQMLMYLNMRMMEVLESQELFGGLPLMVLGDLFQLEPVNAAPPYARLTPEQINKFYGGLPCAPDLWKTFMYKELTTNHRQDGDENFRWRDVLTRVRFGMLNEKDIKYLNARLIDVSDCKNRSSEEFLNIFVTKFLECEDEGLNPVCLLPKRSMCNEYNKAIMAQKGEVPTRIIAKDRLFCSRSKRTTVLQKLQKMDERETAGLEKSLDIAVNTRVMLRINDKSTPGLVNGARGTVREIVPDSTGKAVTKILVKFDDIEDVQTIERRERRIRVMPRCYVYRSMFPLMISYAMTIHKSQSLSLSCVFADLGSQVFCSGMSYVALSRCQRYDGLYLMNFNPVKVKASRRACIEHARMMGKPDIKFNKGSKTTGSEKCWYTSYAQEKATKSTAADVKNERKKRKTPAKPKSDEAKISSKRKKPNSPPAKPKNKQKATKKKPSQPRTDGDSSHEVVETHFGVVATVMDYCPVGESWQRRICNAFGFPFKKISTTADECRGMHNQRRPVHVTKVKGDGHCWYRTISFIVTGEEGYHSSIKKAVIEYMRLNEDVLQRHFTEHPYNIPDNTVGYSVHAARDFIDYHENKKRRRRAVPWADNIVMEFTSCMLKTPHYLFDNSFGWRSIDSGFFPFWNVREYMVDLDASATLQLSEGAMYIIHANRIHFDPAHDGLRPQVRR